jgi:hypothetical protein
VHASFCPLPPKWSPLLRLEGLLETNQRNTIPNVIDLNLLNSLFATSLRDINLLDHWVEILLARKLQHLQSLLLASDVRTTDRATIGSEVLGHHLGQRLVWETNIVEGTIDGKRAHVGFQVEFIGHIGAIEDEVERESEGLGPFLVLGGNKVVRTKFESFFLLARSVGQSPDFRTQPLGP